MIDRQEFWISTFLPRWASSFFLANFAQTETLKFNIPVYQSRQCFSNGSVNNRFSFIERRFSCKVNPKSLIEADKIHLFAGRAVKRERRKGSSHRQQKAYGGAVNEVARELLRSVRCRREKMAAEGTSSTTGRSLLESVLVSVVDSCHCPHPSHPSTALLPIASLSPTRFDAFKDVIVLIVHNMLPILGEQPRHLGYRPV